MTFGNKYPIQGRIIDTFTVEDLRNYLPVCSISAKTDPLYFDFSNLEKRISITIAEGYIAEYTYIDALSTTCPAYIDVTYTKIPKTRKQKPVRQNAKPANKQFWSNDWRK